jgi:hypothetical protein
VAEGRRRDSAGQPGQARRPGGHEARGEGQGAGRRPGTAVTALGREERAGEGMGRGGMGISSGGSPVAFVLRNWGQASTTALRTPD